MAKLKIIADIVALIFCSAPIIVVVNIIYNKTILLEMKPNKIVFGIILSFLIGGSGMFWLIFRYSEKIWRDYPFVKSAWFKVSAILAFPVFIYAVLPVIRAVSTRFAE
jgi:hypothetical protein